MTHPPPEPARGGGTEPRGASARVPGPTVVPFPAPGHAARRAPRAGEPRGEILLFLGVRYERLAS